MSSRDLRVLEVDLSGADIVVGVDKLDRFDFLRSLAKQGVGFIKDPTKAYAAGEVRDYVSRHMSEGSMYALLDGTVRVESQLDGVSISFNYSHAKAKSPVYLQVLGASGIKNYEASDSVDVRGLDQKAKSFGSTSPVYWYLPKGAKRI